MARVKNWPSPVCSTQPVQSAFALAAFLSDRARPATDGGDANLQTHDRVAYKGSTGTWVHRVDSMSALTFYTTGCGMRVEKATTTLTAADVTCGRWGCIQREGQAEASTEVHDA